MVMTMLSFGCWFDGRYALAVISAGLGVLIGWPYIGVLFIPLAVDTVVSRGLVSFVLGTALTASVILGISAAVDYVHYQRFILPVFNHIAYNVLGGGGGSGSELYGTEPASFYFLNLFLNCNVTFIISLMYPAVSSFILLVWTLIFHIIMIS